MEENGRRRFWRIRARLKVRFKDPGAFISEYTHNISKGGLFVRTSKACAVGSMVEVILVLPETEKEVRTVGEVIHVITPEQADDSHPAGMGLEIREMSPEDLLLIENFIREKLAQAGAEDTIDRRRHTRVEAKIRVRFGSMEALMEEYTHNISHGGIYIRTPHPKPLGERINIILTHPQSGQEMVLEGEVVRVVTEADAERTHQPPGMGVRFLAMDKYTLNQLQAFISSSQQSKDPILLD